MFTPCSGLLIVNQVIEGITLPILAITSTIPIYIQQGVYKIDDKLIRIKDCLVKKGAGANSHRTHWIPKTYKTPTFNPRD